MIDKEKLDSWFEDRFTDPVEESEEKECEWCSRIPCNCDAQYETQYDQTHG